MFDRKWHGYAVKAVLAEKPAEGRTWPVVPPEEVEKYRNSILTGWEAHVHRLPNPILTAGTIKNILAVQRGSLSCRVYPPFPLNDPKEVAGAFEEISIPEGEQEIGSQVPLPSSAVKGMSSEFKQSEDITYCLGLRLDAENGFPESETIQELLDQVVQFSHQWWLRSPREPFRGTSRLGASIDRQFRLTEELRYHGAGTVESAWYAIRTTQRPLGFERPLTRGLWLLCLNNLQNQIPPETGLLVFADAIGHYMAREDDRCVLNLAICFEILANKRLLADTGRTEPKNKKLLEKSELVDSQTVDVIKKLIIDRDHVSHGRSPYHLGRGSAVTIEKYLEAIQHLVNRYIEIVQPGEWPELAALRLESTRRR